MDQQPAQQPQWPAPQQPAQPAPPPGQYPAQWSPPPPPMMPGYFPAWSPGYARPRTPTSPVSTLLLFLGIGLAVSAFLPWVQWSIGSSGYDFGLDTSFSAVSLVTDGAGDFWPFVAVAFVAVAFLGCVIDLVSRQSRAGAAVAVLGFGGEIATIVLVVANGVQIAGLSSDDLQGLGFGTSAAFGLWAALIISAVGLGLAGVRLVRPSAFSPAAKQAAWWEPQAGAPAAVAPGWAPPVSGSGWAPPPPSQGWAPPPAGPGWTPPPAGPGWTPPPPPSYWTPPAWGAPAAPTAPPVWGAPAAQPPQSPPAWAPPEAPAAPESAEPPAPPETPAG